MNLSGFNVSHLLCAIGGALWVWIEPTLPFALLCIFAVLVDCISAWRLNRRVMAHYGTQASDGKLKSQHMGKMISDLLMVFLVMLIAQGVDTFILSRYTLDLANWVASTFILIQIVSILENESSCSESTWAKAVQKILADKTKRHLNIDLNDLKK